MVLLIREFLTKILYYGVFNSWIFLKLKNINFLGLVKLQIIPFMMTTEILEAIVNDNILMIAEVVIGPEDIEEVAQTNSTEAQGKIIKKFREKCYKLFFTFIFLNQKLDSMIDLAKADQGERPLKCELNHNHLCMYVNAHYFQKRIRHCFSFKKSYFKK